jgi:hypothetical protein
MRKSTTTRLAWLIAVDLLLLAGASRAQQAPGAAPASAARRGYFTRVETQAPAASPSRAARYRERLSAGTAGAGRGASSDDRFSSDPDPLRPYGEPVRGTAMMRPYEQVPSMSPPQRPAPAASHNYFPGMRPGQGPNRNVVPHCVPGRGAFLHR